MLRRVRHIDLQHSADARGGLVVAEVGRHVPFDIRRMYALIDVPGPACRGRHAHRALEQVFVVLQGGFQLTLDDGSTRTVLRMNSASHAVYVGPMIWRELDGFDANTVCVVLASMLYDEADYIRDYDEFRRQAAAAAPPPAPGATRA